MARSYVIAALALIILTLSVTACSNTFDGLGRDVERAGEKIQDTF